MAPVVHGEAHDRMQAHSYPGAYRHREGRDLGSPAVQIGLSFLPEPVGIFHNPIFKV